MLSSFDTIEKLSLSSLQLKMKMDPEGYETELGLLYNQFKSSLNLFQQQAALSFISIRDDPSLAKDMGDRAMFLAHVTPFYTKHLSDFPKQPVDLLLSSSARSFHSSLQYHVAQVLILLINQQREDEVIAKRSLIALSELHRRKLWFDDRTTNAICRACFHSSSRIMIATLSFLLDYEKIESNNNSDDSSSEDDTTQNPQVALGKQAIYKAC